MTARATIQPVIMSGGSGTRLWPMSRAARPKQFLPLYSDRSLFQETVLRLGPGDDVDFLPPVIIAGGRAERPAVARGEDPPVHRHHPALPLQAAMPRDPAYSPAPPNPACPEG